MEDDINILNINKHFFYSNKEQKINVNYRNKIVTQNFLSVNEAKICHKIKKIPYYSNFFSILNDYEELNISQLNDDTIDKLKNIENARYYLFKYTDKNSIDFTDFLYNFTSIKKLILYNINTFKHLLRGLYVLNNNNICFFDISPKKILFLDDYREKPILTNFGLSLNLNKLDINNIFHILNNLEDFTYLPPEIHIIYYFTQKQITSISYAFIEEFCEEFVKNLNILRFFSENYKNKYKEQCIESLKKYINHSKEDILNDILERNNKWDVYGISMIFLHIFGCITRIFSLKNTFISKITIELAKNIHPNSDKRMTLMETSFILNKYFNQEIDWSFVNNLDNNKLPQLLDELSK